MSKTRKVDVAASKYEIDFGMIGRSDKTKALYDAEENALIAIEKAANELARLKGWTSKGDKYNKAIPSEFYTMLDRYDSGMEVARTYLLVQTQLGRTDFDLEKLTDALTIRPHLKP